MTKEEIQKNSEHWYNKYKDAEKQIVDLKETNAILSESAAINHKDIEYKISVIEQRNKRIAELKQQIEKMKCCFNCKHSRTEYEHCRTDKHEKWEIKEND